MTLLELHGSFASPLRLHLGLARSRQQNPVGHGCLCLIARPPLLSSLWAQTTDQYCETAEQPARQQRSR